MSVWKTLLISAEAEERFRMAYHKLTSSQSNSRNALNITDRWDLTVVEDLKGDFSFNVAANDINTHLSSSTITKNSPQLPCCYCSDIGTFIFLIHMLRSVLYIFCICIFFLLQTRDMSFAISVLKLPLYMSSCCFKIGDFCLIYWFHCTNVLLFCFSLFPSMTSQIYNKGW